MEDIYIAIESSKRSDSIKKFIENYLNGFKGESEYYEYPPFFGGNEFETDDYQKMISFLLQKNNRAFRFYFENLANEEMPKAMMFVNRDGSLLLGVGVKSKHVLKYENKLRSDFESSLIMICNYTLPPDNLADFISISKSTT